MYCVTPISRTIKHNANINLPISIWFLCFRRIIIFRINYTCSHFVVADQPPPLADRLLSATPACYGYGIVACGVIINKNNGDIDKNSTQWMSHHIHPSQPTAPQGTKNCHSPGWNAAVTVNVFVWVFV